MCHVGRLPVSWLGKRAPIRVANIGFWRSPVIIGGLCLWRRHWLFAYGVGLCFRFLPPRRFISVCLRCCLSLFCYRFVSVPPVRGSTYFSLPAAKKSRQKKAAQTASFEAGPLAWRRQWSIWNPCPRTLRAGDKAVIL